jgi:2'-5' RNA ligase
MCMERQIAHHQFLRIWTTYLPHLTVGRLNSETAFAEALREAQSVTCLVIQNLKTGHRGYAIRHKP